MSDLVETRTASLRALLAAAASLLTDVGRVHGLADSALLAEQRAVTEVKRTLDAYASVTAGEIAHRSRRELGYAGLAQREGFRSPAELVQFLSGTSSRDARTMVQVGTIVLEAGDGSDAQSPWMAEVGVAVRQGAISVEGARSIQSGLGRPSDDGAGTVVTVAQLATAAATLVSESASLSLNAEDLFRRARQLRDALDFSGVVDREQAIHEARAFRRTIRSNGLPRYTIEPDLESAALWNDVFDKLMSPRRGGPRFVDEKDRAWAEAISTDPRTPDQYLHDSFTQLLRIAVSAGSIESREIVGSRAPAVRILVSETALLGGKGVGHIEGLDFPISLKTVERAACSSGTVAIRFDSSGQVLDLGRETRLYTAAQKIALAARDGGCRVDGCLSPPSFTEAHHIKHWHRDRGKTDIADGILLCRFHHMMVHNNGWPSLATVATIG